MAINKVIYGGETLIDLTGDTVTADKILSGFTAHDKGGEPITGTISSKDEEYTIPQGHHDGSGKVGISAAEKEKIIPDNIREGITLLGVEGSMSGTEDAKPQAKTVTPSTKEQTVLPNSEEGYNYLSQVTVKAIPYNESENPAGGTTVTIG